MTPTVAAIQRATAEHFGVPLEKMTAHQRFDGFSRPRQVAMYLAVRLTHLTSTQIGDKFDRDRTTIMYAYQRVDKRSGTDPAIAKAIDDITKQLVDPAQLVLPLVA